MMTAESRAHPIIFGTDGWRGILGEDMTAETVARVVQAFAEYLRGRNARRGVAIAYDGRAFSLGFSVLSARILSANGFVVVRSDRVLPTPVLSWTVSARGHDAGIMFTASHNPPKYNGTKFKAACGGPFMTEETHAVERLLGRTPPPLGGQAGRPADLLSPYCEHLARLIRFDIIRAARLHVIIDSMWGAGATILEDLLRRNGCAARTIAGTPEHDFCGRSPEPVERNLSPLMDAMRSDPSAAVGFATDGDADRLGVVLDGGRWLSAQETILLLCDYVINVRRSPGNVVKTCSVTDRVQTTFRGGGRTVHDVQVGFKYITERMVAERIAVGCEESGGFGFGEHIPERDAILSALMLLEMLARSGHPRLSSLVQAKEKEFGRVFYDRIDLPYHADDRTDLLARLAQEIPQRIGAWRVGETRSFLSSRGVINGLKFILDGECRWVLLRVSETEPMVRLYAEGNSDEEVRSLLEESRDLLTRPRQ